MAGERKYTRIPPESTGDRVYMIHTAEINYDAKDVSHVWQIGEMYTITGNGGETFMVHVHEKTEPTTTTGRLSVHYSKDAKDQGYVASDDQSIQYDGVTVATVNGDAYDIYIPAQNIMGYDNPEYGLDIDRFGSASVTFAEGDPEVTVFGKLRTTNPRLLANYDFTNSQLKDQFVNSNEGAGTTVTYDTDNAYVRLFNPAVSDFNRATHTSNLFHAMSHGTGMYFVFGVRLGDAGKEHVLRNWGPFDATDGFFFQMNDTTLNIVHRSSFTDPVDDHTVAQSNWNEDTLDGAGGADNPSGMNLDVTKANIYWVDYQNIGSGTIRYGVFYKGRRIVCHKMSMENGAGHDGSGITNALRNPHRPLCFAQAVKSSGTPVSDSEMFALGGAVYYEGTDDPLLYAQQYSQSVASKVFGEPQDKPFSRTYQSEGGQPTTIAANSYTNDTSTQYLFSLSPIQFYSNSGTPGRENHSVYQPLKFYFGSYDATTGNPRPMEIRIFSKCVIRGLEHGTPSVKSPTVVIDEVGDHIAHGPEIARITVSGDQILEFSSARDSYQYNTVRNLSDQAFARDIQPLSEFKTHDDKYGTGVDRVKVTVKDHKLYGSDLHFFDDKQPVVISQNDGGFDFTGIFGGTNSLVTEAPAGYASVDYSANNTGWYYLSVIGNNEGWLYNSVADLDDDRTVRIVTTNAVGTTAVGDTFDVTTAGAGIGASATVVKIDGNDLYIVGRSLATGDAADSTSSSLDVGLTAGTFDTTTGGVGVGTISTIALNTVDTDLKDYWTSLKAFGAGSTESTTNLGLDTNETLTNPDLSLYGAPSPRQAWVFMARNVTSTTADEDGDTGPVLNNAVLKSTIIWRERNL